jgi:hypothetical protein
MDEAGTVAHLRVLLLGKTNCRDEAITRGIAVAVDENLPAVGERLGDRVCASPVVLARALAAAVAAGADGGLQCPK